MGGLFSSQATEQVKQNEYLQNDAITRQSQIAEIIRRNKVAELRRYTEEAELRRRNEEAAIRRHNVEAEIRRRNEEAAIRRRNVPIPSLVKIMREDEIRRMEIKLIEPILLSFNSRKLYQSLVKKILQQEKHFSNTDVEIFNEECEKHTDDAKDVTNKFKTTTQRHFKVNSIERVINPYLRACYLLRKREYEIRHGKQNVQQDFMFHGTGEENVDSIQRYNFDWRRHGNTTGNIFGKGVSLTPISNYASNYSDNNVDRYMFGVHVLVSETCEGHRNMEFPSLCDVKKGIHSDTSAKPDGRVVVKYRDDEFYPSYLIEYTGYYVKK